jgi:HTH-type transcriptional regulator / antitoxin HipB
MIIRTTKDIAHLVRDQRSRRLLTQANLAELVGVSRKWIVDLEAGKRTADISLVLRTIKALGLDLDVRDRGNRDARDDLDVDQIIERSKRTSR